MSLYSLLQNLIEKERKTYHIDDPPSCFSLCVPLFELKLVARASCWVCLAVLSSKYSDDPTAFPPASALKQTPCTHSWKCLLLRRDHWKFDPDHSSALEAMTMNAHSHCSGVDLGWNITEGKQRVRDWRRTWKVRCSLWEDPGRSYCPPPGALIPLAPHYFPHEEAPGPLIPLAQANFAHQKTPGNLIPLACLPDQRTPQMVPGE